MTSNNMELKAYKLLAQLRLQMLNHVRREARNCVEYRKDKPEDVFKVMEHISNPGKLEYCGLIRKEDKLVMETLEYLLNDELSEIWINKDWAPPEKEY